MQKEIRFGWEINLLNVQTWPKDFHCNKIFTNTCISSRLFQGAVSSTALPI